MKKTYKPYKSLFGESKPKEKGSANSRTIKRAIKELYAVKRSLRKLHEADDSDASVIEDAVESVEAIITDVIEGLGASDPAVASLIDTVKDLEASDEIDDFSFFEAEEDSDDVEEITDGIMQKVDEDEDSDEDDSKDLDEEEGAPDLDMNDLDGNADEDTPPVIAERYKRITRDK